MQTRFSLLMTSLSCLALGSCKDVALGTDGVKSDGGIDGSVQAPPIGNDTALGTGGSEDGVGSTGGGGFGIGGLGAIGGGGIGGGASLGNGGSGGSSGIPTCGQTGIVANEANNYAFSGTLTLAPAKVAPNTDLTFDWSGLTADFMGRALDPKTDITSIQVWVWNLTPSQLQAKLNADTVTQTDPVFMPPLTFSPDGHTTTANLGNFTLNDAAAALDRILPFFDPSQYPISNHVYTVEAVAGTELGQGTLMIQSFQLDPASSNTMVKLTSNSSPFAYSVDLKSLTPSVVPVGQPTITLDWSKMTTTALGTPFTPGAINKAVVGHYVQSLTDLASNFPSLETMATELYQVDVPTGQSVDLSSLKSSTGKNFAGIDGTGTWLVALECGECHNLTPWYLSILKGCSN